jgi:dTDP-4-amino-4,6-dideoxygalactose transaminase
MKIPLVDLKAQYKTIEGEVDEAIKRVLSRADFIQGEDVALFEQEFAAYCGGNEAIGVSSGTEALHLALLACGVGHGDEVITTTFSFIATAEAITHCGAVPVFIDVDAKTLNMESGHIEHAITPRTKAIIPVHLYGRPANMTRIMSVARTHQLKVIEDCAQAHGAKYNGRPVGTIGDVGCFSFYPAKNLGAYGDAGMVVTNNALIGRRLRLLRDHGRREKYEHLTVGFNGRMDTLQAAILRVKLRKLNQWNRRRRAIANMYRERLRHQSLVLPTEDHIAEQVYHLFVVRSQTRNSLQQALVAQNIATGVHYPIPLHLQPAYHRLGYTVGHFPNSEKAAGEVLSLPIYPELTDEQVEQVISAVEKALMATTHA